LLDFCLESSLFTAPALNGRVNPAYLVMENHLSHAYVTLEPYQLIVFSSRVPGGPALFSVSSLDVLHRISSSQRYSVTEEVRRTHRRMHRLNNSVIVVVAVTSSVCLTNIDARTGQVLSASLALSKHSAHPSTICEGGPFFFELKR
ncbi:hypothetical protein J6590_101752, partial [Homalodisca vitripennis]